MYVPLFFLFAYLDKEYEFPNDKVKRTNKKTIVHHYEKEGIKKCRSSYIVGRLSDIFSYVWKKKAINKLKNFF